MFSHVKKSVFQYNHYNTDMIVIFIKFSKKNHVIAFISPSSLTIIARLRVILELCWWYEYIGNKHFIAFINILF